MRRMKTLKTIFVASVFFTLSLTQNDIRIPPSITSGPPRNFIYRAGDSVTLDCKGEGVPAVTYDWKKNGLILSQKFKNIQRDADGTMTIHPATSVDEGFYQCFARNQYGTALSNTTHLQRAFLDSSPQTPAALSTVYCYLDMPCYIQCDRRKSFPKPTYNWERADGTGNPVPLRLSERIQIADNGDLHFGFTDFEGELDGRRYRCTTYNPFLDVKEGGNYTKLCFKIHRRRRSIGTKGFSSESPTVALIGGSATLRCFFYRMYLVDFGRPTKAMSKISWLGPRYTLPAGRYTLNAFNTSLTIDGITASDEGNYNCSTSENWHILQLRVEEVPMFRTVNGAPYDVNVTEGESFTFRCNPVAKPVAKIVWLQDGNELDPSNPPERFVFSNNRKSLTIRDVCRNCVNQDRETDLMVIQCNASNVHGYAFAQGYLNVFDTYCDNDLDKEHSILWNRTLPGKEIFRPCPGKATGLCSRKCFLNSDWIAFWSKTNYNGCFDKEFKDLLDRSYLASSALETQKIASRLSALTNKSDGLSPGNLNASVMIINWLAILRSGSNNSAAKNEIKSFVQATSNVLQPNNSNAWKELKAVNKTVATAILFSVDIYGRSLSTINISEHSTEYADYMVLEAWSLKKSNPPLQVKFPSRSVWDETSCDKISISMEAIESSISSESQPTLNMWGSYYRTVNDYLPGNAYIDFINSRVLSFSIGGLKAKEKVKRPVLITLQHNQEEGMRFRRTCAFWNFDRDEWDSTGCSVTSTSLTHTTCSCDHLTNFAVLMSTTPSHDKVLSLISIIGCSISVVALILTILVYALTWKQSKSAQATVLLNLCVTLTIAYIIFMTGADKVDSKDLCKVVAVLLHYFFLAAFFIMLIEGVEMVLSVFFVFHVRTTIETTMLVASAWVLPLIIVGVSLGSTKLEGYGDRQACWLSVKNGLIWAFVAPVLCIITVNFVILSLVLRLLSKKKDQFAKNRKKRDEIRATLWNLSVTCPLLGLGWLFGIFSLSFDYVIFQYLFVITNSLQGLLIFVFHGLFHNKTINEKISSVYSSCIGRCRKTDLSASTQMTPAQGQPTKKTDKEGFVPRAVKHYEGMRKQDNLHSAGKRLMSIEDSDTLESTH